MKRLLLVFVIGLLFVGCAPDVSSENSEPTGETQTTQNGWYEQGSRIETDTNGAVRVYSLQGKEYDRLLSLSDGLVLISCGEQTSLTVLTGEYCYVAASAKTEASLAAEESCKAVQNGLVYYDDTVNKVMYLDRQLQITKELSLPEQVTSAPVIDEGSGYVYFCIDNEIRCIDPDTGIPRLVKEHTYESLSLSGCYFDGTVLACRVSSSEAEQQTLYVSAQTGETLAADAGIFYLQTAGKNYFAVRNDSVVLQKIYGNAEDGISQSLNIDGTMIAALPLGGVIACQTNKDGVVLSFYQLSTGKMTAKVELCGIGEIRSIASQDDYLWLLCEQTEGGEQVLFRWDMKATPTEDETVYTGPLYTAASPDEQGLAQCQIRASEIGNKYSVDIRIWKNAVSKTGDYTMIAEHQVQVMDAFLSALAAEFEKLPENFLKKSANGTYSGRLHICIVREIFGGLDSVQYWQGGDPYIVIATGADIGQEFWKMLGYVVDSRVLGNSLALDDWDSLNPSEFAYSYDYANTGTEDMQKYLEGELRAFIDEISMCFPTEDRARVFAMAVSDDAAGCFASETMQKKLRQLCIAIRDAYGLTKSENSFLWEQYLAESIAYEK